MPISFSNADIQLGNSATTLLSSSIGVSLSITRCTLTNDDTVDHNLTLYRVNSGETPGATNVVISPDAYPGLIKAGETQALPLTGHNLVNGQAFYGMADAASVINISFSYVIQS